MSRRTILVAAGLIASASLATADTPTEGAAARFEAGDLAGARAILVTELEANPESAAARYLLGRIELQEENADAAIDHLKQAVKLEGENSTYRGWLGRAYVERLQSASFFEKGTLAGRGLEQLKKAVELDPANVEARITLAHYYLNAPSIAGGSAKKARAQIDEIMRYDPVEAHGLLAGIYQREKKYEEAIEMYHRCIEARPDDTEYRYQLAMLHQKLEQYDETFRVLEDLLEVDPEATAAMYQIGRTAVFASKRLDRGLECLQDYLEREVKPGYPSHGAAWWRIGMLYERKGDRDRAREAYETAVRLDPDEEAVREALAALDED